MTNKNSDLCGCGTIQQAVERAVELTRKQVLDDECAVFVIATAFAYAEVGKHSAISLLRQFPDKVDAIASELVRVQAEVASEFHRTQHYVNRIQEAIDERAKAVEQEGDQSKEG